MQESNIAIEMTFEEKLQVFGLALEGWFLLKTRLIR